MMQTVDGKRGLCVEVESRTERLGAAPVVGAISRRECLMCVCVCVKGAVISKGDESESQTVTANDDFHCCSRCAIC